jgi:hypothetical protein
LLPAVGIAPGIFFIMAIGKSSRTPFPVVVHRPENLYSELQKLLCAMMLQLSDSAHLSELTVSSLDVIFL